MDSVGAGEIATALLPIVLVLVVVIVVIVVTVFALRSR